VNLPPLSPQPLVSIVTPSFNQASFLEQTMRSVLEQGYPRLEYFVVDGGSTDGSVDIIRHYADRLAGWVSEKDRGQADAIRKGMARASGEIVAWLNSDDFYLPDTVSSTVQTFRQYPDAVLVYGDMLAVDEEGQTLNLLNYRQLSLEDLLRFQIIGQPAVFFRRDAYDRTGGLDIGFHYMLDHHLWIRLAQLGRIVHVPQAWAAARYHPQAKNRALAAEFGREAFRILEWAKEQPELADVLAPLGSQPLAAAHRVDARYLLDGGQPFASLRAWSTALFLHPATALRRLNILVSALLQITGLSRVRDFILHRRKHKYSAEELKS
jgi:GT2 family glycosyltransferase